MAGLLDTLKSLKFNPSPLSTGLMMGGAQMMQAGAPSLAPKSFGTALGGGLEGLIQGAMLQKKAQQDALEAEDMKLYREAMLKSQLAKNETGGQGTPGQWFIPPGSTPFKDPETGLVGYKTKDGAIIPSRAAMTDYQQAMLDPAQRAKVTAGIEGQKLHKFPDSEGREGFARGTDLTKGALPDLLPNLIQVESSGNPNAVSNKGAVGLTQIMPETARNPGYGVNPMRDNSPDEQIRFGADYLRALLKENNGDIKKALSAYNAGQGTVEKKGITNPGYVDKVLKGIGPSMQDKAALEIDTEAKKKAASLGAEQQADENKKSRKAGRMFNLLTETYQGKTVPELIEASTGSGVGAMRDKTANFFGADTEGGTTAAALKTLSGWLTAEVPRMEGPQSDADRAQYEAMAGMLGDPLVTSERKMKAYNTILEIAKRQAKIGNPEFKEFTEEATTSPKAMKSTSKSGKPIVSFDGGKSWEYE